MAKSRWPGIKVSPISHLSVHGYTSRRRRRPRQLSPFQSIMRKAFSVITIIVTIGLLLLYRGRNRAMNNSRSAAIKCLYSGQGRSGNDVWGSERRREIAAESEEMQQGHKGRGERNRTSSFFLYHVLCAVCFSFKRGFFLICTISYIQKGETQQKTTLLEVCKTASFCESEEEHKRRSNEAFYWLLLYTYITELGTVQQKKLPWKMCTLDYD